MNRHSALLAAGVLLSVVFATSLPAAVSSTGYSDWSTPVNLGPVVNSALAEQGPALSGDSLSLYFYSTNRPGGSGSDDIWVSQRPTVSAPWGAPVNVGPTINTASRDYVPAFSSDGHWMFFASDRPGGFGPPPPATPTPDLYQSYRADIHDDFSWTPSNLGGWQEPTNLGPNVNTAAAENGNGYFDNGGHPQLFFGSERLGPPGNADLYVTNRQADGSWAPATRIPELSSPQTENRPNLRADGLEIFFYSGREPRVPGSTGTSADLWTATRASVDAPWSTPVNLGVPVNSINNDIHAYLSSDGQTLIFGSTRAGGMAAAGTTADLWMTTRVDTAPPVIAAHADIHVLTGDFRGIVVAYTPPNATDNVDGTFAASCAPASGSLFPVGDTTVVCGARDAAGNGAADSSFHVFVTLDVDMALPALANDIDASSVDKGLRQLLTAKIALIQAATSNTCKKVDGLLKQLDEKAGKEGLTAAQAAIWHDWASAIADTFGC
jgi:hypothetical protein